MKIAPVFLVTFLLIGCGDGASVAQPQTSTTPVVQQIRLFVTRTPIVVYHSTPTPNDGVARITIGDDYFEPATIIVKAGTTIEWWHGGGKEHTIASLKNDFPTIMPGYGGRYRMTFNNPGEYPYTCSLHSGMNGMIRVTN